MTEWIATQEAAQRLGVKRATLYTYVSRGLLTRRRGPGESLFARDEIDALVRERRHPSAPAGLLAMRSVRSVVSDVREGELFLRGVPLADLADEPFGDVVDMVLGPGEADEVELPGHVTRSPLHRRLPALAQWAGSNTADLTPGSVGRAARGLLDAAPLAYGGRPGPLPAALFDALAGRPAAPAEAATINAALVSLIDHGLAASVVAARVAASARASAYDCLLAGYAALSGRLHGGIVRAALGVLRDGQEDASPQQRLPGFGHWRHPDGDPRADVVLARLALVNGAGPVLERVERTASRLGTRPNIDGALAALILVCGLPDEAGEVFFQVGRTAGMAAHVVEELGEDPLRWRARDPRS